MICHRPSRLVVAGRPATLVMSGVASPCAWSAWATTGRAVMAISRSAAARCILVMRAGSLCVTQREPALERLDEVVVGVGDPDVHLAVARVVADGVQQH